MQRTSTCIGYNSTKANVSKAQESGMHSLAALRLLSLHFRIKDLETYYDRQQESKGCVRPGVHCYV